MKLVFIFLTVIPLISAFCTDGFNQNAQWCFKAENTPKNWTDAETACQQYGSDVHLATIDAHQVYMCSEHVLDV